MSTYGCGSAVRLVSAALALIFAILVSPVLAQRAERPEVKVGDEWQFVQYYVVPTQKPNFIWVITAVTPTSIVGTENDGPLKLDASLNVVESSLHKFSDRRHLSFPLTVGSAWTFRNRSESKLYASGEWYDAAVTVAAYEKVTVQAGQFDAFRFEVTGQHGQQGAGSAGAWDFKSTYWYAPSAKAIVKEVFRDARTGEMVRELVAFKLQP